jgi:hypothetical protein
VNRGNNRTQGRSRRLFERPPENERGSKQAPWLTLIGDFTQCWEGSEREPVGQRMTGLQQNVDKLSYLEDIAAQNPV